MIDSPLDKHEKVALHFSGGKDSLAVVQLLANQLDRVTIYHGDTGDQLPEQQASVAYVEALAPHFVRIRSDVRGWIKTNGLPSDLVPYASHPIGRALGQETVPIVPRYDCCWENIMRPLLERTRADGCTLLIRGTKRCDAPAFPFLSGDVDPVTGIEFWYPLEHWTDHDVLAFLRNSGAPVPPYYDAGLKGAPDCAHCTAWLDEGRGAYLKAHHPEIWREYRAGLIAILQALGDPMRHLQREMQNG